MLRDHKTQKNYHVRLSKSRSYRSCGFSYGAEKTHELPAAILDSPYEHTRTAVRYFISVGILEQKQHQRAFLPIVTRWLLFYDKRIKQKEELYELFRFSHLCQHLLRQNMAA